MRIYSFLLLMFFALAGASVLGLADEVQPPVPRMGDLVIPARYQAVGQFTNGLALVQLDNRYGFIDKTGKEVALRMYDDAFNFSDGLAAVQCKQLWGFIDLTGKEVIPPKAWPA